MSAVWRRIQPTERALRVVVPVGTGLLTWLVLLVAVGLLFGSGPGIVSHLVSVLVVGFVLWPLVAFAPWRDGLTGRLREWTGRRRQRIAAASALFVAASALVAVDAPQPLLMAARLPAEVVGFYGLSGVYRERVGVTFTRVLVAFGRGYLQALWLYLLADPVLTLVGTFRRS